MPIQLLADSNNFDYMLKDNTNLVTDIIDSLIEYLNTGEYIDKSGVAKKNYSPDLQTISHQRVQQTLQRKDNEDLINRWHMEENKKINYNKQNMNTTKKTIRLTESKLRSIIAESVKRVLSEGESTPKPKLLKKLKNNSDFIICLYEMPNGCYVITTYDFVLREHEKEGQFNSYEEAIAVANKLNKEYSLG